MSKERTPGYYEKLLTPFTTKKRKKSTKKNSHVITEEHIKFLDEVWQGQEIKKYNNIMPEKMEDTIESQICRIKELRREKVQEIEILKRELVLLSDEQEEWLRLKETLAKS